MEIIKSILIGVQTTYRREFWHGTLEASLLSASPSHPCRPLHTPYLPAQRWFCRAWKDAQCRPIAEDRQKGEVTAYSSQGSLEYPMWLALSTVVRAAVKEDLGEPVMDGWQ